MRDNDIFTFKKQMTKTATYCFALLFLAITAVAQPRVSAILDNYEVNAAEGAQLVQLQLQVSHEKGVQLAWPLLQADDTLGGLEILDVDDLQTQQNEAGQYQKTQNITLLAVDSGLYQIPSIAFSYNSGGAKKYANSEPLLLHVTGDLPDEAISQPVKENKPNLEVPYTFAEFIPYIAAFLISLLLLLLLASRFRKKPEEEVVFVAPPLPPHEQALESLRKLERKRHWQQGRVKQYYIELSEIVRQYIEDGFKLPALESTTDEILEDLRKQDVRGKLRQKLSNVLSIADLVKFAKLRPDTNQNTQSLEDVKQFVVKTKQKIIQALEEERQAEIHAADPILKPQPTKSKQNLPMGIAAGFAACIIAALLWALITVTFKLRTPYMAIGAGILVGVAVRIAGRGTTIVFGIVGATLALLSCLLGNYFSIIGLVANADEQAYFDTLLSIDFASIPQIMRQTFKLTDLIYYGIALYVGYFVPVDKDAENT